MTTPQVYVAISNVMAGLARAGIGKVRKNESQGYKFRGIDDVYNALAPLMAGEGLCILPKCLSRSVTERQSARGGVLFAVVVDVEFTFASSKDGSHVTVRVPGEAMDSADKATNKAMSAAYKYACLQTFCIPTEGDNDADAHHQEVKAPEINIDLQNAAIAAAKAGRPAFADFWASATPAQRSELKPQLETLKMLVESQEEK